MSQTPPRLLMALALVAAGALVQLSVVVTMVSLPPGIVSRPVGALLRIQFGTELLDLGVLLLVPLAVLLARLVEPSAASPAHPATRTVLLGASAVGAASGFLLSLRLVADLVGDARVMNLTLPGALVYDVGLLLIAVAGAFWAYRELGRTPSGVSDAAPLPPPAGEPSPPPSPPGFPSGPPLAPPPAPERPPS